MLASLYQWLVTHPADDITALRDRAWQALRYTNDAAIQPILAQKLFPTPPARKGEPT